MAATLRSMPGKTLGKEVKCVSQRTVLHDMGKGWLWARLEACKLLVTCCVFLNSAFDRAQQQRNCWLGEEIMLHSPILKTLLLVAKEKKKKPITPRRAADPLHTRVFSIYRAPMRSASNAPSLRDTGP